MIYAYDGIMLKYILLGFLNYQPMSGYDLKSLMDESTGHFWHAYHSQIYTTLRKLEADGLLESEEVESDEVKLNKRVYSVTESGRKELIDWQRESMTGMSPVKEDLLVRLFFSGSRNKADTLSELMIQRQLHQQKLDVYNRIADAQLILTDKADPVVIAEQPYWLMTLEFGKRYEQMYVQWLSECIAQIEAL